MKAIDQDDCVIDKATMNCGMFCRAGETCGSKNSFLVLEMLNNILNQEIDQCSYLISRPSRENCREKVIRMQE